MTSSQGDLKLDDPVEVHVCTSCPSLLGSISREKRLAYTAVPPLHFLHDHGDETLTSYMALLEESSTSVREAPSHRKVQTLQPSPALQETVATEAAAALSHDTVLALPPTCEKTKSVIRIPELEQKQVYQRSIER